MDIIDWQGSRNCFRIPMGDSYENGLIILTFTRNMFYLFRSNPNPGFNILYLETNGKLNILETAMGLKVTDGSEKTGQTDIVEELYKTMRSKLNGFDDEVRPFFGKESSTYKTIWGANRNRFYRGSYESRENAMLGLAGSFGGHTELTDATADATAFYNALKSARETQQGAKGSYKGDNIAVNTAMEAGILQQHRNLGWLNFYYALLPNAQASVNAFFPLENIINHSHNKIYHVHIGPGGKVAVALHSWKGTDRLNIYVDGKHDALICNQKNTKMEFDYENAFRARTGIIIDKLANEVFTDLTLRQVMAVNTSADEETHLIFEIIEQ